MPDPRGVFLDDALDSLKAVRRQFPDDPLVNRFDELIEAVEVLRKEIVEVRMSR